VDPRAGLYDMENRKFLPPPELKLRPVGRPVRSQSLYRLRYPGSLHISLYVLKCLSYQKRRKSKLDHSQSFCDEWFYKLEFSFMGLCGTD
jgi:hypothetical protein